MGVKVHTPMMGERVFPEATDWYISDERVLQIYELHGGDPEFVVMEFNREGWEAVEWDPPIPPDPQPGKKTVSEHMRDAQAPEKEEVVSYWKGEQ